VLHSHYTNINTKRILCVSVSVFVSAESSIQKSADGYEGYGVGCGPPARGSPTAYDTDASVGFSPEGMMHDVGGRGGVYGPALLQSH